MLRFNYLLEKAQFDFKQYQYDGVKWCIQNELRPNPPGNARGGFIADEMGLGKTIMMIGTMFANFLPRTLIVAGLLFCVYMGEILVYNIDTSSFLISFLIVWFLALLTSTLISYFFGNERRRAMKYFYEKFAEVSLWFKKESEDLA
jgi:hypothetical protein